MITEPQRESLFQFFAGHFHQDWRLEADTPDQVISRFAREVSDRSKLSELSDALLAFVASSPKRVTSRMRCSASWVVTTRPAPSGSRPGSGSCV